MEKRTNLSFDKHELIIEKNDLVIIHWLKIPDTIIHNIKFINVDGKLLVTGDYDNWIFDRNFIPYATNDTISEHYWCEKLTSDSVQNVYEFDSIKTEKRINELINGGLVEMGYENEELEEMINYYINCLYYLDYEYSYISYAYNNYPSFMDGENVVYCTKYNERLNFIFDAFEEICFRLNKN